MAVMTASKMIPTARNCRVRTRASASGAARFLTQGERRHQRQRENRQDDYFYRKAHDAQRRAYRLEPVPDMRMAAHGQEHGERRQGRQPPDARPSRPRHGQQRERHDPMPI